MDGLKIQKLENSLRLSLSVNGSSARLKFDPWNYFTEFNKIIKDKSGIFDAKNGKIIVSKKELYFSQDPSQVIIRGEEAVNKFFLDNVNYFKNYLEPYSK